MNNEINYWLNELKLSHLSENYNPSKKNKELSFENFSGGELQRISLIRSFLKNNNIEVYDEPTTFLDVQTAKIIRKEILRRSKNNFAKFGFSPPGMPKSTTEHLE